MLLIKHTACCAVDEIFQLSHHTTAKDAMKAFCKRVYEEHAGTMLGRPKITQALYLFTGVIRHTDGSKPETNFTYGPEFAQFIKDNGLGKVRASFSAANRLNHPTHVVKAWLWRSNEKAVKTWWKKNKK